MVLKIKNSRQKLEEINLTYILILFVFNLFMIIKEIYSSSIITKSNLPDSDFVINPYVGCMHSCVYCYARFMKRFTGHLEEWGKFVDVKVNAPGLIPKNSLKYKNKSIFLSSVTDPYIPLENKYLITRQILEKLINFDSLIYIQTKSDLVLRDIDIIKQFKNCDVGITITTINDDLRSEIDPLTSSVEKRINALKKLKENGIKTYVFIGPIFPELTDWKKIIQKTKKYADYYCFENLNVKGSIWESVKLNFLNNYPNLLSLYKKIYFEKNDYWNNIKIDIENYCLKNSINYKIYFDHK
jgi:DNA repair photolyase